MEAWRGRLLSLVALPSMAVSLGTALVFDRQYAGVSLFMLSNLVGATTASLMEGHGLTACTMLMGTPGNPICFHGGRMPVPTLVMALGVWLLGNDFVRVGLLKAVLLLVPMEAAIYFACRGMLAESRRRRWIAGCLLLAPFGMTAFLADVVNLQVEEGYSYALLALATAILLFRTGRSGWLRKDGWGEAAMFGGAVAGLYLSKSAMAAAAAVLTIGYVRRVRGNAVRVLAVGLAMAAPLGWAMYQYHATGRYSLGTSLDGFNLRKGNDAAFLAHYPPRAGGTLDQFDNELNAGVVFPDEWRFNDFHQRAAVAFMRTHPGATVRGAGRKLELILVSVQKYGSGESHGLLLAMEMVGMVVFRLIFWTVIGVSVVAVVRGWEGLGADSAIFLLLVGAVALPYVVGFAYTRHVSVLIYPSVLMGCRLLGRNAAGGGEA